MQMEERLGPLGTGAQALVVGGRPHTLGELMQSLGLDFDDIRPIDALTLHQAHYAIRYFDSEDRRVVAHEFDDGFRWLGETRVDLAEWIGDEYYEFGRLVPLDPLTATMEPSAATPASGRQ